MLRRAGLCKLRADAIFPAMIMMETNDRIPQAEVGRFVQQCLDQGARIVVVTPNPDRLTCSVCVQRE